MSDIQKAYNKIIDFLRDEKEKTLLISGIADKEKHLSLLKALNSQGELKGLINLIHTSKSGMEEFFRWADLYDVKVPNKYGHGMRFSNLTIYFNNLTTKIDNDKYDDYTFDFMIIWPIVSITKNKNEIKMLQEMTERQSTKKVIYLTIKEPWVDPSPMEDIVDHVIRLDCENDNPTEYQRILTAYELEKSRQMKR